MGYPQQPQDPYGQYGQYGQQPHSQPGQPYLPQPYSQPYQAQPYSQPYTPAPMPGPQYGPVQYTTVKEYGFNPFAAVIHVALWVFFHWWLIAFTFGLWLLVAVPVTLIGWRVTRHIPVQQVHYQQQPHPPHYG